MVINKHFLQKMISQQNNDSMHYNYISSILNLISKLTMLNFRVHCERWLVLIKRVHYGISIVPLLTSSYICMIILLKCSFSVEILDTHYSLFKELKELWIFQATNTTTFVHAHAKETVLLFCIHANCQIFSFKVHKMTQVGKCQPSQRSSL